MVKAATSDHYQEIFQHRKQRILATAISVFTYGVSAFRNDVTGVTLVDMQAHTGSTSGQISLVFVFCSAAGLLASIFLVPLHNRYNTFLLMGVFSLVYSLMLAACPWSDSLVVYIAISAAGRFPHVIVSSGVFITIANAWQQRPAAGPVLQFTEVMYSCGAALAPLVAIPLLSQPINHGNTTVAYSGKNNNDSQLDNYVTVNSSKATTEPGPMCMEDDGKWCMLNLANNSDTLDNITVTPTVTETKVQYLFVITAILYVIIGILCLVVFSTMDSCMPRTTFVKKKIQQTEEQKPAESEKMLPKKTLKRQNVYQYGFYISVSVCLLFVVAHSMGYPSFLVTFAYYYLELSKETGALLNTAFNIAGTVSCILHIFLTARIDIDKLLIAGCLLCAFSTTCLLFFIHYHWIVIWVCTILISVGSYPGICLMQAYGNRVIGADGKFQSFAGGGLYVGLLVFPSVIGLLFDTVGTVSLLYVLVVCSVGFIFSMALLKLFERKLKGSIDKDNTDATAESAEAPV